MTLQEARDELEKFVQLKTTMRPQFVDVLLDATEVKRGRWGKIYGQPHLMKCSVCGSTSVEGNLNYCPNCGSRMMDEVSE